MVNPDAKQLNSLVAISQQHYWGDVEAYVEALVSDAMVILLANADTNIVNEMRGRIKALQEFLSTVRTARETMEKQGRRPTL